MHFLYLFLMFYHKVFVLFIALSKIKKNSVCFKMYDLDGDGKLNEAEIRRMVESMIEVASQTKTDTEIQQYNSEKLVSDLLKMNNDTSKHVTLEEFLVWTVDNVLAREMGNLIVQLCHVCLGLRPSSRAEEGHVVRGWLAREERGGLVPGQVEMILLPLYQKRMINVKSKHRMICHFAHDTYKDGKKG